MNGSAGLSSVRQTPYRTWEEMQKTKPREVLPAVRAKLGPVAGFSHNSNARTSLRENVGSTMSAPTPTQIRALRDAGTLSLGWSDGTHFELPFKYVRGECPCAACIDEFTGARILDLDTIPETIIPEQLAMSGNYALKISWSDGHSTGLYTWEHLYQISKRHTS